MKISAMSLLMALLAWGCQGPRHLFKEPPVSKGKLALLPGRPVLVIDTKAETKAEVVLWQSPDLRHWAGYGTYLPVTNKVSSEHVFYMVSPMTPVTSNDLPVLLQAVLERQ